MRIVTIALAAALAPLWAQEIKLPANLEKLAAKAEDTVDITLDGTMLRLAGRFLSDKDGGEATAKKLLAGLQSITVRSFQFARDGEYSMTDVDEVRAQVKAAPWSRIVGVTSKRDGDNVDVYLKDGGNGQLGGILLICAEPRELTIVSIVGNLDPAQLADLGGQFGIPRLDVDVTAIGRKGAK
ncbi:MAG TPA: DUF4252 domain-containing protein [Bryobacteraceae bacterium]|nr:DUF4252 domain-containing protein [Bryobacteraceae bacterium]